MPPAARTHTIAPPTPELLTESFCERCGTRYTFESEAPKTRRPGLGRARVLTRGLKNWVVEDGRSIEAAMADARRDEERGLASAQLEAFHQTFNFCMDCRQYTCVDCWNQAEGRCQTCAPLPAAQVVGMAAVNGADAGMAWPTSDLASDEAAEAERAAEAMAAATPYIPTDLRPVELPDDEIEMMVGTADSAAVAAAADVEAEAAEIGPAEVETVERGAFVRALAAAAVLADETPLAPEAAADEVVAEEAAPPVDIEAVVVEAAAVETVAAAADAPAEAEPIAAAEPALEPEPELIPATRTPTPGWTIVAPDAPDTEAPSGPPAWPPRAPVYQPPPTVPATPPPTPGQPGQPSWPTLPPAAFTVPAAQAVWEASSLSVISRPGSGVQACVSCGLPLSASARFCRRCGSRQG